MVLKAMAYLRICVWLTHMLMLHLIIGLEIAALGQTRWFRQGEGSTSWEGGILRPTPDSHHFSDDKSYHEYWEDCENGRVDSSVSIGQCRTFHKLYASGVIMILFSSISMFMLVATILIIYLDMFTKIKILWFSVLTYWISLLFYFFAVILWHGLTWCVYEDHCKHLDWGYDKRYRAHTCAEEGATIALSTLLFHGVATIFYTVTYLGAKKMVKKQDEQSKIETEVVERIDLENHAAKEKEIFMET
ncbi:unnamed protein product [Blepharisma stoltei]|uniref:MARVEL domain-containing protein n=1 Tax=Blepharisma stoltei TaxID=1481888 RepID=A0AAU9KMP2_9CILI|nr:unnamed protein product [Blepharisma stoltei]